MRRTGEEAGEGDRDRAGELHAVRITSSQPQFGLGIFIVQLTDAKSVHIPSRGGCQPDRNHPKRRCFAVQ